MSALLSLNKVSISRATADITIELNASRILNRREFKKLERAFAAAFPGVQVELRVRYPALKAAVEQDVKLATGLLSELVAHESPASMPFLEWNASEWKLEEGKLTVCVTSPEGADFLKARGGGPDAGEADLPAVCHSRPGRHPDYRRLTGQKNPGNRPGPPEGAGAVRGTDPHRRRRRKAANGRPAEAVLGKAISETPIPMNQLAEDQRPGGHHGRGLRLRIQGHRNRKKQDRQILHDGLFGFRHL